ncbi:DNA topoisomerase IB (plasmid) [Nostoc sp. UHCC 0302]|uniref:DNA topoisomerase IB n=1 Tax=Nostoc sp. UHCC 0302 TaxID=3134896 RepID=UPI00311C8B2C
MQLKLQKKIIKEVEAALAVEPLESAKLIGLHYVSDTTPGIKRQRMGEEFCYFDIHGQKVDEQAELDRIKALIIPPAWNDVWICPHPQGHLQATGRDAKGRKQYRYHTHWHKVRSQTKFTRMIAFGQALPKLRQRVQQDLALPGLPKEKVLATIVKLLEITKIRVGNEEYAQTNKSFGLTTMRDRHVDISGCKLKFKFRGKSGVEHEIDLSERRLAKIVKKCQELPGQELFQYQGSEGSHQPINSSDVNGYLSEITELDFTAKDFRTWFGTVLAVQELYNLGKFKSQTEAKKNITQAIKNVADELGNRPATCRKYYIHPGVLDAYIDGSLLAIMEQELQRKPSTSLTELHLEERVLIRILEQYLLAEL